MNQAEVVTYYIPIQMKEKMFELARETGVRITEIVHEDEEDKVLRMYTIGSEEQNDLFNRVRVHLMAIDEEDTGCYADGRPKQ